MCYDIFGKMVIPKNITFVEMSKYLGILNGERILMKGTGAKRVKSI